MNARRARMFRKAYQAVNPGMSRALMRRARRRALTNMRTRLKHPVRLTGTRRSLRERRRRLRLKAQKR